jgi:uracil-DNA glycosylase
MFNKDDLLKDVKKSWLSLLDNSELDKIIKTLNTKNSSTILPTENRMFQAFKYFELKDTKIILLGQDPYIGCEQAMGLSFSVPKGCSLPPSLKNIYKELNLEDQSHGDLTHWVKNNQFLMLNASLSVFEGSSYSHQEIWKEYTDKLIKDISDKTDKVIFLLLGSFAQSKIKIIDTKKHVIITGVHPSPLSAYRGFFGSGIFDKLDSEYEKLFEKEINWGI